MDDVRRVLLHREPIVRMTSGETWRTVGVEILRRPVPFGESRREWIDWYRGLANAADSGFLTHGLSPGDFISVNMDSWQFGVPAIMESLIDIAQILSETGHVLGIEWTERGASLGTFEILRIVRVLDIMRARYGSLPILDDMGAGMDYHRKLSFLTPAYGKIDGELFRECVGGNMKAKSSIRAIKDLLSSIGSISVVEWVEQKNEAILAASLGIDAGQGFFWSVPFLKGEPFPNLLQEAAPGRKIVSERFCRAI